MLRDNSDKKAIDGFKKKSNVIYFKHVYPLDHWAVNPMKEKTHIAIFQFRKKYRYLVKLNPTDSRGYRTLVTYLGKSGDDIQSTFNRPYTLEEEIGLLDVTTVIIAVYKQFGIPIVHCAQAGNNSTVFDLESETVQIGSLDEPNTLHMHLFARGDVNGQYISDITLKGPELGIVFDMRGTDSKTPGNDKKVKWDSQSLLVALHAFTQTLLEYSHSEEFNRFFNELSIINYQKIDLQNESLHKKSQSSLIHMFRLTDLSPTNWTFHPRQGDFCLARITVFDRYDYILQLNRHDRRGHRILITYIGENTQTIYASFKFPYTTDEQKGLLKVAAFMMSVYKNMGFPIVQIVQYGNNSQAFDKSNRTILLGNKDEPYRLLLHVFARGNPKKKYARFLPSLEGPYPGKIFDTRATSYHDLGNEAKITWTPLSKLFSLNTFTCAIAEYMSSEDFSKEFSETLVVEFDKNRTKEDFNPKKITTNRTYELKKI